MNKDYLKQLGDAIAMAHWAKSNETTYEEICDRVVNYICDDPSEEGRHYNHRMKDLLKQKKFIPNSPCWINAGTDMKNLFACYVIDLQDNMSSIMDTAKRMAMIMKEGGGVGVSLTPIRAEGSRVGGEGSERTASGPISFLKVFDAVVGAVKSAGVRRGAALANLKVGHPDLVKFIKCKEDQNQINNFNLSVAITDEFMDDVINNSEVKWALGPDGKGMTAPEIYDLIVEHMWQNGEPGVQFIDAVNNVDGKYTGRPEFRDFNTGIEVSNPCVTGNTVLMTKEGNFPIEELVGKEVQVWNGDGWSKPVVPFSTGVNSIVKVKIKTYRLQSDPDDDNFDPHNDDDRDITLFCTPYHKFILAHSMQRVKAEDLEGGEELLSPNCPGYEDRDYYISDVVWLGEDAPTYCLTEPDNHAMTLMCDGIPLLTSQCGETYLKPNEACNLASINLYHFVNPFWKGKDENKDMALRQELKQTVEDAVDFLNKMLDKSETPFPEINEAVKQSRKVGLGVMGLADYLSAKGIVYGSPEAVHEAADVFAFITKTAEDYSLRKGYKNATLTVQAPTGTTGLVGEVSTGIEPHFLRCWTRHSLKMGDLLMYPKSLRDYIFSRFEILKEGDQEALTISLLYKAIRDKDFNLFRDELELNDTVIQEIKKFWPTAHEVTPKQHLAMLAAIQRHVHNSVSKTINLPHDATVEDVRELIMTAWRTGVKGFTCYRDGSRDSQPLKSIDSDSKDKIETNDDLINHIRLDMTEEKRMEYLEKMSDEEPVFADTILKAISFDKMIKTISNAGDSADKESLIKDFENGEVVLVKKDLFEAMNKFSQLGYDAYVDQMSNKLANSIMKDNPEIWPNKCCSQEQKTSCKRPRPAVTHGESIRTKIGCGTMYITVNRDDQGICEVFTSLGRKGGCPSQSEATSRLISLALRSGVKIDDIIDQLKGIRCLNTMRQGGIKQEDGSVVLSCPDAIGKALERVKKDEDAGTKSLMKHFIDDPDSHISDEDLFKAISSEGDSFIQKMRDCTPDEIAAAEMCLDDTFTSANVNILNDEMKCPDCGEPLARDGGCVICRHCGYSKCG